MTIIKLNPDLRDKYAKIENISDEKHMMAEQIETR